MIEYGFDYWYALIRLV